MPGTQLIDGALVETDHRAKRPADEVKLVLDNEIGGPDGGTHRLHPRGGMSTPRAMPGAAVMPRPEQAVTLAFFIDAAEKGSHLRSPGHHGKFVDGSDHHGRWTMIYFLVDHLHRQTPMGATARTCPRKFARTEFVAAMNKGAAGYPIDLDVTASSDFGTAPGATSQLCWRSDTGPVPIAVAQRLDRLVGVFGSAWRHPIANP